MVGPPLAPALEQREAAAGVVDVMRMQASQGAAGVDVTWPLHPPCLPPGLLPSLCSSCAGAVLLLMLAKQTLFLPLLPWPGMQPDAAETSFYSVIYPAACSSPSIASWLG